MTRSIRLSLACLALPLTFTFSNCGDGLDLAGPAGSASGGTTGTPTPTPRPAATPTATPAATATPGPAATCTLPSRPDCGNNGCCPAGGSDFFGGRINTAQAELERTRPEIFNNNGSLKIDELEYTDLLAVVLMRQNPGLCARGGGRGGESISKDEVAIKESNDLSQNIDVIIGSSNTPYQGARHTCRPASF